MSNIINRTSKAKKSSKGEVVKDTLVVTMPDRPSFAVTSPIRSDVLNKDNTNDGVETHEQKVAPCIDYTKVFTDSSERLNDRRERTNQFYWLISGVILSGEFFTAKTILELNSIEISLVLFVLLFFIAAIGIAITNNWKDAIENYGKVSLAKVVIVQGIETQQQAKHFTSQSEILDELDYIAHTTLEQRNPTIIRKVHECVQCLCSIGLVFFCIYLFMLHHGYLTTVKGHEIFNRHSIQNPNKTAI